MNNGGPILQRIFESFKAKLTDTSGFSVPRRQYIATGEVVDDTEQFVVQALQTYPGMTGQAVRGYQAASGGVVTHAMDIDVLLVRCVPSLDGTGRPPKDSDLTRAALNSMDDATALSNAFYKSIAENAFVGVCDNVALAGVTWNGPSGGLLRTTLSMSVQL